MFPNHPSFLPIVNLHSIFHPPLSNPTNNRPFHNVVSHQTSKKTTKPSVNSKPKNLPSNFQFKHFPRYKFQATLFPNRSCHFVFLQNLFYTSFAFLLAVWFRKSGIATIIFYAYILIIERIVYYLIFLQLLEDTTVANFLPASSAWFSLPFYMFKANNLSLFYG